MTEAQHTPGPWHIEEALDDRTNKAQHTPGPWSCKLSDDGERYYIEANDGCSLIAETAGWYNDGNQPGKANARLIAAAPELLALAENIGSFDKDARINRKWLLGAVDQARAAIAKAKGE